MPNNKSSKELSVVGRRKEAVARVRLSPGNGQIIVNGKPIAEYFPGQVSQRIYNRPSEVTKTLGEYTLTIKLKGGGKSAQLGALVHGISRALAEVDPKQFRPLLKKEGFLTRDPRAKERRKYGHAHKARARKQSPKR